MLPLVDGDMAANEMRAILVNCPIPRALRLGEGITLGKLPEGMGYRGEMTLVRESASLLGVDFSEYPEPGDLDRIQQPAALLTLPPIDWQLPDTAQVVQMKRLFRICEVLSVLTSSTVDPIAAVVSRGDRASLTFIRRQQPFDVAANSHWWSLGKGFLTRSEGDARFALLLNLYRSQVRASSTRVQVFHCAQFIEFAAEFMGFEREFKSQEVAIPVRRFIKHIGLWDKVDEILELHAVELRSRDTDPIGVLYWMRNRIAHEGEITEAKRAKWDHPLVLHPWQDSGVAESFRKLAVSVLIRLTWPQYSAWGAATSHS